MTPRKYPARRSEYVDPGSRTVVTRCRCGWRSDCHFSVADAYHALATHRTVDPAVCPRAQRTAQNWIRTHGRNPR